MITDKTNTFQQSVRGFIESFNDDQINNSSLISFSILTDEVNFYSIIKHLEEKNKDYFYYSRPEQNFAITAIGEVLSFTFKNVENLNNFSTRISDIQKRILHNFDTIKFYPPLFFCSAKFPSGKSSEEWKDFDPVRLYIPEIVLVKKNDKIYLTFNVDSHLQFNESSLIEKFFSSQKFLQMISDSSISTSRNSSIKLSKEKDYIIWKEQIENVLLRIENKELDKLVLSRSFEFDLLEKVNAMDLAATLDQKYPECFNFIYKLNGSYFFCASPEKLFIIENGEISTEALAGSIERGNNETEDKNLEQTLMMSSKDIDEHDFVIDHLRQILEKYCEKVRIDNHPALKKLSNIQHLHTGLSGSIKKGVNVFSIISDIFPTPAVGGYPVKSTLTVIDEIEDFERGLFTGFTGWMNQNNNAEFIVAIRSGLINSDKLYIYAGCGIVQGSDPEKEFEETQLKAKAIISLFNYENKSC